LTPPIPSRPDSYREVGSHTAKDAAQAFPLKKGEELFVFLLQETVLQAMEETHI